MSRVSSKSRLTAEKLDTCIGYLNYRESLKDVVESVEKTTQNSSVEPKKVLTVGKVEIDSVASVAKAKEQGLIAENVTIGNVIEVNAVNEEARCRDKELFACLDEYNKDYVDRPGEIGENDIAFLKEFGIEVDDNGELIIDDLDFDKVDDNEDFNYYDSLDCDVELYFKR